MRRRIRYRVVTLKVSENFYRNLENSKENERKSLGLPKLTYPDFTEMLSRSGYKIKTRRNNAKIKII